MHDPRIIKDKDNVTKDYINIQCLKCGSVFRSGGGYGASHYLINCEEEQRNRKNIMIDSIPMMVTPDSEKYDPGLTERNPV